MRKWTYLVAALLMAGTTATFTGCIDTDEPEGIAELRGAKSELIKAQSAVELVEVEMKKALVAQQELINAGLVLENKATEIGLQLEELNVKLKQLEVEAEEAKNAEAKAKAEAAIAKAEAEKTKWEKEQELVIEQYKEKMLIAETATAQAQEAYKQAMEQIEASKYLLTEQEQIRMNGIQAQVAYAKQAMDKALYGYSTTVIKRVLASETTNSSSSTTTNPGEETTESSTSSTTKQYIYVITEAPTKAEGGYQEGSLKKLQEALAEYPNLVADNNLEAVLNNALKRAEYTLEGAQKYADALQAILDNEYTTVADWEAEVKKLEEEIAAAKVKEQQYNIEKGKLEVANPKLKENLTAAQNEKKKAEDKKKAENNTAKTAAAYSKKVEVQSVVDGLNTAVGGSSCAGYSNGTFSYAKDEQITAAQKKIDGWIKLIEDATKGINLEEIEWAKPQLDKAIAKQKEAEDTYTKDYKAWEDAIVAYDESLKIDLEKSEKAAKEAIDKYNKLGDADRKKEANIDAVATALVTFYKDALAKEAKVTTASVTKDTEAKTISAWLIASADNFKKIVGVNLGIITWDAGDISDAKVISADNIKKLTELKQDTNVDTPLDLWKKTSEKVFGNEFNSGNNPRRLPVSESDVIAKVSGNKLSNDLKGTKYGTLGNKIWATAETARLQAVINQADTYKALKEAFTAQKAVEQAAQDKANKALADAVTKAKKAEDEAQAAYDKVFKEVEANITAIQNEYGDKEKIKGKIEQEITTYLNNNFTNNLSSLEAIKNLVKAEHMTALEGVTAATADVAKAKRNIEKLAAGTYTDKDHITESLASIQEKIEVKQAEYDAAKADYDEASAQLKAILAIFLK